VNRDDPASSAVPHTEIVLYRLGQTFCQHDEHVCQASGLRAVDRELQPDQQRSDRELPGASTPGWT